jgi:hypothetical protein
MSEREYALEDGNQNAGFASSLYRSLPNAKLEELPVTDDSVLPFRQLPNRLGDFAILHRRVSPPRTASNFRPSRLRI